MYASICWMVKNGEQSGCPVTEHGMRISHFNNFGSRPCVPLIVIEF